MKILHIYNDYYPPVLGGIEKHINTICEGLTQPLHAGAGLKHKFQIQVLVASRKKKTVLENINGVEILRIAEFGRFQSAPVCPSMPIWLKKLDPDILHFHLPCPTGVISYFLAKPKGKVIVTYHSDIVRQRWTMGIYGPLLVKFLNRANCIIATSPNYIDSSPLLKKFKNKCVVISHGVDTDTFRPYPTENEYILFVGKLRYYKGLTYLIKAMPDIKTKLLIIGTGNEERRLKNLAVKLGLQSKIGFLGNVSEQKLSEYYQNCSIFVLPSIYRSEAFGIVQLEAMACGKPVVSTKLDTGVPWVNKDSVTGFVVPPKNSLALADAINSLLKDSKLRRNMGRNGRERVEKEFNKKLMIKRTADVYERTLTYTPQV